MDTGEASVIRAQDGPGSLIGSDALVAELAEPLLESAPIAYRTALQVCPSNCSGADCTAYHAVWQYLRLAGTMRSMRVDGALFVAAAERLARGGGLQRVLISGSADYSMLAHLSHG